MKSLLVKAAPLPPLSFIQFRKQFSISLLVFVNLFHLLSLTLPAHSVNLFFYKP